MDEREMVSADEARGVLREIEAGDREILAMSDAARFAQTVVALHAEVRRLTAYTREVARILLDEVGTDGPTSAEYAATLAVAEVQVLRRERAEHAAALATARREGAEAQIAGAEAVRNAVMGYLDEIFPGGPAATNERWPHELMEHVACAVARAKRSAGGAT